MLDYKTEIKKSSQIKALETRIRKNGAMKDVYTLAEETGNLVEKIINTNLEEAYPDGRIADEDVRAVVSPVLKANHAYVSELAAAGRVHGVKTANVTT